MKKAILFFVFLLAVCAVSCSKKQAENKPQPTKEPQRETQKDNALKSDDVKDSDDAASSDDVELSAKIYGSWQSDGEIISLLSTGECVIIRGSENIADTYTLSENVLTIKGADESYTVEKVTKSKLVLTDADGESTTYSKLSHTKRQIDLTEDELVGKWSCRIVSGDTFVSFELDLREDGTMTFTENSNGTTDELDNVSWRVSKGRLILDNGSDSSSSVLKYSILRADANSFTVVIEKCAVIFVKA